MEVGIYLMVWKVLLHNLQKNINFRREEPELDLYETGKDNYFFTRKKDIPNSALIHEDFLVLICHNISSQSDKSLDHPNLYASC